MAKSATMDEPQVFRQVNDERGRVLTDRPLTPEEAAAQDEAHKQHYLVERARSLTGPDTPA